MNYRHIYHAGNFADVVKHAVLCRLMAALKRKDKPFHVLDTHAGLGSYDLESIEARKTGEAALGIGRLLAASDPPELLSPYLDAVRALNGESLRWYPGSPRLIRALLRPGDRLAAVELHPADARALADEFKGDRQVKVHELDGYHALKAFLPPSERRGLILIDPPFEVSDEFERLAEGLAAAHRRFAGGIFVVWYPIKDQAPVARFHQAMIASGLRRLLAVELRIWNGDDADRLNGSGLLIVNPPFGLVDELRILLPYLARLLAREGEGGWRIEELVGE